MKIIFLDIDGVLWPQIDKHGERVVAGESYNNFDKNKIAALNYILESDDAVRIVISSSWRLTYSLEWLKEHLLDNGLVFDRVVGVTPYLGKERGREIQSWLTEHGSVVESFVIIDDDSDMVHLTPHLYKTSFDSGLTMKIAEKIVKYFSESEIT